jgi:ABC-type branched-subunit amino acid transport system substrate-binding protein
MKKGDAVMVRRGKSGMFFLEVLLAATLIASNAMAQQSGKEWVIPYVMTQTGPYAALGGMMAYAAQDAAAQVNAKGGASGRLMRIVLHDDAGDPTKAVAEMSKVIEDNLIIFGPVFDPSHQAVMPLVKRMNAFTFCVNLSPMTWEKFKGHAITLWPDFEDAIGQIAPIWFKQNPGIKSVVTIFDPRNAFFVMTAKVHRKVFEANGVKALNDVELGEGVDVGAAVIKAMAQNPDAYALIGLPGDQARVLLELDKRGVKEKRRIFLYPVADAPDFYTTVAGKAHGAYLWNLYNTRSENPAWRAFMERYIRDHKGIRPGLFTILAQNMVFLAKRAIDDLGLTGEKAKLVEERKKLMAYMINVKDFHGVTGTLDIVDYRAKVPTYLFRVKENDLELVKQ